MKAQHILQFIWSLPATLIVWLFYVLPLWLLSKDFKFEGWFTTHAGNKAAKFRLQSTKSWYAMKWRDWYGWGGPYVMLLRQDAPDTTIIHEGEHVDQMARWGLFFYPVYLLECGYIYLLQQTKHPYYDNHFEVGARRRAGQRIEIPPKMWGQGPDDRWPWW